MRPSRDPKHDPSRWLDRVCLARLPTECLGTLATRRDHRALEIARDESGASWARWSPPDRELAFLIHQVIGSELYEQRDGYWYVPGRSIPEFGVSSDLEFQPVASCLLPGRLGPIACWPQEWEAAGDPSTAPIEVRLAVSPDREWASALRCGVAELASWAEHQPPGRLRGLRAAWSEGEVLLRGERPPWIPGARRYWGNRELLPLGHRLDPEVSEALVARVLGATTDFLVLWDGPPSRPELIPEESLQELSLASARWALKHWNASIPVVAGGRR